MWINNSAAAMIKTVGKNIKNKITRRRTPTILLTTIKEKRTSYRAPSTVSGDDQIDEFVITARESMRRL